ncbi:MAG: lipopolysaccharide biosynthesis protein [Cytophagales bacterium]|nr:lipopolysaccharide biosynthesis protein [Cytophagales bacterium]
MISTLAFFVLAKLLGATQFGLVSIAYAFIDFGNILVEQGMVSALVQKEKPEQSHLDTAFWINIGLGALVFLAVFLTAPVVAGIYEAPLLTPVLRTTAVVFLVGPSGLVHVAQLTREMDFKAIALIRIVGLAAGGAVGVGMAFLGHGVWALVFQKIVFISLSTGLFWLHTKWMPRLHFSKAHFRELFSFSYNMLLNNFMIYFSRNSTSLIIGLFLGPQAVGLYSFGYKVFQSTIEIANMSVNKVMLPLFASVQGNKERLAEYFYKAVKSTFVVVFSLLALIMVLSREAITRFFGQGWGPGTDLLNLIAVGGSVYMIFYYVNTVLVSVGRPDQVVRFNLVNGILNVALVGWACQYGLIYVGYAAVLRSIVLLPVAYWFVNRVVPLSLHSLGSHLYRPFLVGLIAFLVLLASTRLTLVSSPAWLWFAMQGAVWAGTVLAASYWLVPSTIAPVLSWVPQLYVKLVGERKD